MSSFGWLDYSEKERRKMLEVVDLFKERETRDELGIGGVRDAFADLFFPGTSTIMTRARYFLLIAWIYRRLEAKRVGAAIILERARRAETSLIEAIERSEDNEGNIGKYAKTALKRLPSSVYWQGMGVWGIRAFAGSQAQYHRSLDRHYAQVDRHGRRTLERESEHDDLAWQNWHAGLIPPPEEFPDECSLRLTRVEAEYLVDRIRFSPLCANSLLTELVGRRRHYEEVAFPWMHACFGELPPVMREMLLNAQNFSELMLGAGLLYNLILAEQAGWDERLADYRERFAEWAQLIGARSRAFSDWNRDRFWEFAITGNPRIRPAAREFVNSWWDMALGGGAERLCEDVAARRLITDRERRLKKDHARIDNPRAQELWNGDSGSGQLEFRWLISQRLLGDIFQGLEVPDA